MPELPEVETIIRGLAPRLVNRRIASVEILLPQLIAGDADHAAEKLRGRTIRRIRRHGKYILFELHDRRGECLLVVHLRMTGNLILDAKPGPHTRAIVQMEDGPVLIYNDIRKFGRWQISDELPERLRQLGPEPLEITGGEFLCRLRGRRTMIKALLLDQEFLRGLGNIYADESLFRARIHPAKRAATIGRIRAARLREAIRHVLSDAIAQGGSTIRDFVNSAGEQGYFQLTVAVYGRTGEGCRVCGGKIRRMTIAGRSTHFCPRCQRR